MVTATVRRLTLVVLIAGVLCTPATAAMAQTQSPRLPPGIGVKLLQGPADSTNDPRAHEYIIDHLAPGVTISRQIGVSNGDSHPVYLTFYAVAANIENGVFEPGSGRTANELTSWITLSPASATIQPGQTLPVLVTIAVPADATAGERYAAALADDTTPPGPGGGITSVSRVGIRIYLSVGPGAAPKTAFTIDSLSAGRDAKGNPLVTAEVHNSGGRAVDLSGQLQLTNRPSSLSAGPFPVRSVATLAPGQTGELSVVLDPSLPNGPWDARITVISGLTSATATAELTFPTAHAATSGPAMAAAAARPHHSVMLTGLIGGMAVGALALLFVLYLSLRRHRRLQPAAATL
jgi:hypothetical protein